MGADLEGSKEEGNRPPPCKHIVQITFDPYDYSTVQNFLQKVTNEFPKRPDRNRWTWKPAESKDHMAIKNVWIMDFHFRDIEDAIIFGLKYSR